MKRRIIILAAILLIGGGLGVYLLALSNEPETEQGAPIVEVKVPRLSANARNGELLFSRSCAGCHGENAAGREGLGPPLIHKIYEPGHHADGAFYIAVKNGVRQHHWPFGNMEPVPDVTESQVAAIIDYVRLVQRHNGIQ